VVIVNTCGFIREAKEESIETILAQAAAKEGGRVQKLVVTGCLPQRYGQELLRELPEVDLFVGTGEFHRIADLLDRAARRSPAAVVGAFQEQQAVLPVEDQDRRADHQQRKGPTSLRNSRR
jgi:tRNA A37 methylthiotransferase MiaB